MPTPSRPRAKRRVMMAVEVPTATLRARLRSAAAARVVAACLASAAATFAAPAAATVERDPGFVFVSSTPTDRSAWAHNVPAGTDRFVLVAVTIGQMLPDSPTVASVLFANRAMTLLGSATGASRVRTELWGLADPPVGAAGVELRLTGSGAVVAGSVSFRGVNPAAPTGPLGMGTGSGTVASVAVPSGPGEYVVDVYGGLDATPTAGAGQSVQWDEHNAVVGASSGRAGAAGAVMSWDHGGVARPWVLIAVALKPLPPPPPDAAAPPDAAVPPADTAVPADAAAPADAGPPADTGAVPAPDVAGSTDTGADRRAGDPADAGPARDEAGSTDGAAEPPASGRKVDAEVGCACSLTARGAPAGTVGFALGAFVVWCSRRRQRCC